MNKPPTWFWIVAVIALLWSIAGCASYLNETTLTEADLAQLPAAQAELHRMLPSWLTAVFAVAAWGGLAAAIALLLRRQAARWLYGISLAAVIVQFGYIFVATPIFRMMSFGEAAGVPIVIAVAQAVMIWFSGYATKRGWLR